MSLHQVNHPRLCHASAQVSCSCSTSIAASKLTAAADDNVENIPVAVTNLLASDYGPVSTASKLTKAADARLTSVHEVSLLQ